jgi:PAS domain S-box-containing protein
VSLGPVEDLREGLHLCLHMAIRASGLDCGGIYLRDEAAGAMDLLCHTGLSDDFVRQVSHYDGGTAHVQLALAGEPLYAHYAKLPLPPNEIETKEALQAIAIVPIIHRQQVIGCLNVASHSSAEVPPHARIALETIAGQISGTIARLKAERALRESEQRFRTLFEAAPDVIYVTDLEGTLVNANKAAEQLSGIPRDQAIGRSLPALGLLSEGQIPRVAAPLQAGSEGKAAGPEEVTLRRRDGVCLTLETRTFPITIDNRILVLGIARDITERKCAEKQAREHHEQLLHISRLSTLGEMASGFAHELNQPLSAILSYASAARRSVEQPTMDVELLRRDLDQVIAQAKRAGEIVKRVRAFVQRRPALLRPTDPNDIIREALAFLRFDVLHKEIQVVLDLGAGLPRVQADAIQLEQALLNLVRNAIEAM